MSVGQREGGERERKREGEREGRQRERKREREKEREGARERRVRRPLFCVRQKIKSEYGQTEGNMENVSRTEHEECFPLAMILCQNYLSTFGNLHIKVM